LVGLLEDEVLGDEKGDEGKLEVWDDENGLGGGKVLVEKWEMVVLVEECGG